MLTPPAKHSKSGSSARGYSGEKLLNYFSRQGEGVSPLVLMGRSGFVPHASASGPVRAINDIGGKIIAASGGALWRIDGGKAVFIKAIPDDENTYMAASGTQMAIVAGGRYFVTGGTGSVEYTTGGVETPHAVVFMDGYFIVTGETGGRNDAVATSALDDATTFNGLDFGSAESSADAIMAPIIDHGELWLLGEETVEVWYNNGGPDFPLSPSPGARIEHGCSVGKTVAKADNAVFWVGNDATVYRSGGGTPQVISTREVEEDLERSEIMGGFTFRDRGHRFYAITRRFGTTLCFDITTGLWSEFSTGVPDAPWICTCSHRLGGIEYFGTNTGKVGVLSSEAYTDDTSKIEAEVISTPIEQSGNYVRISKLHVNLSTGYERLCFDYEDEALTTHAGADVETHAGTAITVTRAVERKPQIMLQISHDGQTWGRERWRDMGAKGEYFRRTVWHGLGAGRRMQARLRITDPVKRDLYGVHYA